MEETTVNVGRYPFADDLDKKIFMKHEDIFSIRTLGEARKALERAGEPNPTAFQLIKFWSYSRLANYEGLAIPLVVCDE